ncbi:hypothetical protein ACFY7C_12215 [Streptomyces sp. NPDC012769]|uniref:hypothetical protein n=1 Tax=Streptomyces sp. NPDC012769 TaxID=3364848 RepID=UPI0036AB6C24
MRPKTLAALAAAALTVAGLAGTAAATSPEPTTIVADTGWGRPAPEPTPSEPTATPVANNDTGWG